MNNKAVIFDLDGTLLNTLADLTDSVNYAMMQLNLNTYKPFEVRDMIGNGVAVLMKRALTAKNIHLFAEALQLQRKFYFQHGLDNTIPFDGVNKMLSDLKKDFILIVHTNKDENIAKPLCENLFGRQIDFVCGTLSDSLTKPNAQRLLCLLDTLNNPQAVYCGDSEVDLQTAQNAHLPCISVTWGYRDEKFLSMQGAKYFAKTPQDVAILARFLTQ